MVSLKAGFWCLKKLSWCRWAEKKEPGNRGIISRRAPESREYTRLYQPAYSKNTHLHIDTLSVGRVGLEKL